MRAKKAKQQRHNFGIEKNRQAKEAYIKGLSTTSGSGTVENDFLQDQSFDATNTSPRIRGESSGIVAMAAVPLAKSQLPREGGWSRASKIAGVSLAIIAILGVIWAGHLYFADIQSGMATQAEKVKNLEKSHETLEASLHREIDRLEKRISELFQLMVSGRKPDMTKR